MMAHSDPFIERQLRKAEFLRKMFELFSKYSASFEVQVTQESEVDQVVAAELYIDGNSNLVGTGRGGISTSDVERMLNCAVETIDELACETCGGTGRVTETVKHVTDARTKWQRTSEEQITTDCPHCEGGY